jgi:hypothetical protein
MGRIYLNKYELKNNVYISLLIIELIIISSILFISPFVINFVINNNDDSDSTFNQSTNDYAYLNYLKLLRETILNDLSIISKKFLTVSLINNNASKIALIKKVNLISSRAPPYKQ